MDLYFLNKINKNKHNFNKVQVKTNYNIQGKYLYQTLKQLI